MRSPCTACTHKTVVQDTHRVIEKCESEEYSKGFYYDDFFYDHECTNHAPKTVCLTCELYQAPYCKNVYVKCVKE